MTDRQYVVPMLESESGWGSKIDGHAGPFDTFKDAADFRTAYNEKYNNEDTVPSWYIAAMEPVVYKNQVCDYKVTV